MAVNFRSRLRGAGFTERHAGNYEFILMYNRQDAASPQLIRESLQSLQPDGSSSPPPRPCSVPSTWDFLQGDNGCITNWAGFYRDVGYPDATLKLHLPLYNTRTRKDFPLRALAMIFKANRDTTALAIFTRGVSAAVIRGLTDGTDDLVRKADLSNL
jgi:hypothetical protein